MKTLEEAGLTQEDWIAADKFGDDRERIWSHIRIDHGFFNSQMTDAFLCGIEWARKKAQATERK